MTPMQWLLVGLGDLVLIVLMFRWLKWNTRLPLGSRVQQARRIMRRQTARDLEFIQGGKR